MQLKTYTGLWNVEKRLYKFYDINLPYPVSVKQVGILIAAFLPWTIIMNILRVPFESPWHLLWLGPPVAIAWFANRPIAEGKNLTDFALSQIKFFLSPKKYTDLTPQTEPEGKKVLVTGEAWRRT